MYETLDLETHELYPNGLKSKAVSDRSTNCKIRFQIKIKNKNMTNSYKHFTVVTLQSPVTQIHITVWGKSAI